MVCYNHYSEMYAICELPVFSMVYAYAVKNNRENIATICATFNR